MFCNKVTSYLTPRLTHLYRGVRNLNQHVGVVGVPFAKGQPHDGVIQAPQRLRDSGLCRKLEMMSYIVHDYGDMQFEEFEDDTPVNNIKYPKTTSGAAHKISNMVSKVMNQGHTCLTLGGDHSMTIGTLHGHAQAEPEFALFWVDAHCDLNLPLASPSGNIHGMVLSLLLNEMEQLCGYNPIPTSPEFNWLRPCISAKNIAYIGVRDLDPAEKYVIEKLNITCYTTQDIDQLGIDKVMEMALDRINPGLKLPIHLSYDVDALDPVISPSTGTPVPGGLSIREGMFIAETISSTGQLTAIDLVEVNPTMGNEKEQQITLYTATEVMAACFGKRRKGNVPVGYVLPTPVPLNV